MVLRDAVSLRLCSVVLETCSVQSGAAPVSEALIGTAQAPVVSPLLLIVVLLIKPERQLLHPAMKSDLHGRPQRCEVRPWL